MTREIFAQAMEDLDKEFREEWIHVTMLLDNFGGHGWREDKITNIQFIFFSLNLTPHVQPADARIIQDLKAKYGKLRLLWSLDREEAGEEDIFAIDLLQVMHLLTEAWDAVKLETIQACWCHTGILPSTRLVASIEPVPEVEAEVADAAIVLQNLNAAIKSRSGQCANLHNPSLIDNIEVLLAEPAPPIWPMEDNNMKDLIAAVEEPAEDDHDMKDLIAAMEEPAEGDHDMPVKEAPPPARQEVLAAMRLLSHIAIDRRNGQEFLQLFKSHSLVSDTLRKEAHKEMSTTRITDFFSSVSNQKNTATEMETDGSTILMSDSEPKVLDGISSHLHDGRSWISIDD